MSAEGESDDSTTIRRKILLSPTMPPRDSMDHGGSPLANLIGQVRLPNPPSPPLSGMLYRTVSRAQSRPTTKSWGHQETHLLLHGVATIRLYFTFEPS